MDFQNAHRGIVVAEEVLALNIVSGFDARPSVSPSVAVSSQHTLRHARAHTYALREREREREREGDGEGEGDESPK